MRGKNVKRLKKQYERNFSGQANPKKCQKQSQWNPKVTRRGIIRSYENSGTQKKERTPIRKSTYE